MEEQGHASVAHVSVNELPIHEQTDKFEMADISQLLWNPMAFKTGNTDNTESSVGNSPAHRVGMPADFIFSNGCSMGDHNHTLSCQWNMITQPKEAYIFLNLA
jgi:hypothetical protein